MGFERLLQFAGPHLHLMVTTPDEATNFGWSLARLKGQPGVARFLRGDKMRSAPELFDEFAAALQFPYYFGENWNALLECLTDLEWLPDGACVLFIMNAPNLLAGDPEEVLTVFFDLLEVAAEAWATADDGALDRPRRPFHAVFQCAEADEVSFLTRVQAAGFTLDRL